MRLFVGVTPPAAAAEELDAAARRLRRLPASQRLRWTDRAGWHLTLAFLGEVEDAAREDLYRGLAAAADRRPPLRLRLEGAGRFGGTVLWAGVGGDVRGLAALAEDVRAAAQDAGIPADDHEFLPHLSLARTRGRAHANLRPLTDGLAGFTGRTWTADSLELIESRPGEGRGGGSLYTPVNLHPLGGAAAEAPPAGE